MGNENTGKLEMLWFNSAEAATPSLPSFRPPASIRLCVSTLARICRHLPPPRYLDLPAIFASGVLGHCGYLRVMSKKKSLSLPENFWLWPSLSQSLSLSPSPPSCPPSPPPPTLLGGWEKSGWEWTESRLERGMGGSAPRTATHDTLSRR